jgi:hypothetical protein
METDTETMLAHHNLVMNTFPVSIEWIYGWIRFNLTLKARDDSIIISAECLLNDTRIESCITEIFETGNYDKLFALTVSMPCYLISRN